MFLVFSVSCSSWSKFWMGGLAVASLEPLDNATGIAIFAPINITFNTKLDANTISGSSVALTSAAGSVAADISVSDAKITLKPKVYLSVNTRYTISLTTSIRGDGNVSLTSDTSFTFTTIQADSFVSHVGTSGGSEQIEGVARFSDGSYALVGTMLGIPTNMQTTSGVAPISGMAYTGGSQNDCFVGRFNTNGAVRWYAFVGTTSINDQCHKAVTTKDDGLVVVGKLGGPGVSNIQNLIGPPLNTPGACGGSDDFFIAKFSGAGQPIWWTCYGGTGAEDATGVAQDSAGNLIITGAGPSPAITFDTSKRVNALQGGGATNTLVVKLTANGSLLWYTYFGDTTSAVSVIPNTLTLGLDDSVLIAAPASGAITGLGGIASALIPPAGAGDALLVKLASSGAAQWYTYFGGAAAQNLKSAMTDTTGNFILAGDSGGSFTYQGKSSPTAFTGGTDTIVASFSPAGTINGFQFFGGSGTDNAAGIAPAADGGFALLASTSSGFTFQGKSVVNPYGGGLSDFVMARYDANQQLQWITGIGTTGFDQPNFLTEAFDGGWLTVGSSDTNNSGIGGKVAIYNYATGTDGVYHKVKSNGAF